MTRRACQGAIVTCAIDYCQLFSMPRCVLITDRFYLLWGIVREPFSSVEQGPGPAVKDAWHETAWNAPYV